VAWQGQSEHKIRIGPGELAPAVRSQKENTGKLTVPLPSLYAADGTASVEPGIMRHPAASQEKNHTVSQAPSAGFPFKCEI